MRGFMAFVHGLAGTVVQGVITQSFLARSFVPRKGSVKFGPRK
uniref:Uncharacterized protein n=1 Tax=Arundo donax TaxID=35708 RepID=A0A0A9G5C2_ARUDO